MNLENDRDSLYILFKVILLKATSLPYFGVKLSCVCLMFAYRKIAYIYLKVTYSYPKVTYSDPKVTYSDPEVTHSNPTHLPLPLPGSPGHNVAIS